MTLPRSDSVWALYALTNSMMLTPCWPSAGPTGGAGVAAPAWICSLMTAASFFLGGMSQNSCICFLIRAVVDRQARLDLGHLIELQLDRGLPAEDRDQHLEALGVQVHLADGRRKRREGPVGDGDRLTHRVLLSLGRLDALLL